MRSTDNLKISNNYQIIIASELKNINFYNKKVMLIVNELERTIIAIECVLG